MQIPMDENEANFIINQKFLSWSEILIIINFVF